MTPNNEALHPQTTNVWGCFTFPQKTKGPQPVKRLKPAAVLEKLY